MFFKMTEPTESCKSFAFLPYIKGITEPLHTYIHTLFARPQGAFQSQITIPN